MRHARHARTILVLGLALLLAGAGVRATPAAAAGPSLTGRAASVNAGATIDFDGAGFVPGERLSVWVTTVDQIVLDQGFEYAAIDGTVHFGYGVPGDAIGGQWAITVFGQRSATPAIAWFSVVGREAPNGGVYAGVTPEVGGAGTTFTFFALGYDEKERYSYWFTGPDGVVYDPHSQERRTNDRGRAEFEWTPPAGLPTGRFVVTIQGVRSGVARGVVFELR